MSELRKSLPSRDLGITMVTTSLASLNACFASLGSYSTIHLGVECTKDPACFVIFPIVCTPLCLNLQPFLHLLGLGSKLESSKLNMPRMCGVGTQLRFLTLCQAKRRKEKVALKFSFG